MLQNSKNSNILANNTNLKIFNPKIDEKKINLELDNIVNQLAAVVMTCEMVPLISFRKLKSNTTKKLPNLNPSQYVAEKLTKRLKNLIFTDKTKNLKDLKKKPTSGKRPSFKFSSFFKLS